MNRTIQPLGEQIIIRTIPQDSVGSILIPDSAKGITMMGEKGAMDAVHAVDAEVVAVGPGKRQKGDQTLTDDLLYALNFVWDHKNNAEACDGYPSRIADLHRRAENQGDRIPPQVKPGDKILYHPAVQKFDRDITEVMRNGNDVNGAKYFMIREESVLAVIER